MVPNRAKHRKCELFLLHLWYLLSSRESWVCSWSNLEAFTWKNPPNSGHKRDRKARINCPTKIYTEWAGKKNRFCYTWHLDFTIMFSCKCVSRYIFKCDSIVSVFSAINIACITLWHIIFTVIVPITCWSHYLTAACID